MAEALILVAIVALIMLGVASYVVLFRIGRRK